MLSLSPNKNIVSGHSDKFVPPTHVCSQQSMFNFATWAISEFMTAYTAPVSTSNFIYQSILHRTRCVNPVDGGTATLSQGTNQPPFFTPSNVLFNRDEYRLTDYYSGPSNEYIYNETCMSLAVSRNSSINLQDPKSADCLIPFDGTISSMCSSYISSGLCPSNDPSLSVNQSTCLTASALYPECPGMCLFPGNYQNRLVEYFYMLSDSVANYVPEIDIDHRHDTTSGKVMSWTFGDVNDGVRKYPAHIHNLGQLIGNMAHFYRRLYMGSRDRNPDSHIMWSILPRSTIITSSLKRVLSTTRPIYSQGMYLGLIEVFSNLKDIDEKLMSVLRNTTQTHLIVLQEDGTVMNAASHTYSLLFCPGHDLCSNEDEFNVDELLSTLNVNESTAGFKSVSSPEIFSLNFLKVINLAGIDYVVSSSRIPQTPFYLLSFIEEQALTASARWETKGPENRVVIVDRDMPLEGYTVEIEVENEGLFPVSFSTQYDAKNVKGVEAYCVVNSSVCTGIGLIPPNTTSIIQIRVYVPPESRDEWLESEGVVVTIDLSPSSESPSSCFPPIQTTIWLAPRTRDSSNLDVGFIMKNIGVALVLAVVLCYVVFSLFERHRIRKEATLAKAATRHEQDFVAFIFHELRNPLNGAVSHLEFAGETLKEVNLGRKETQSERPGMHASTRRDRASACSSPSSSSSSSPPSPSSSPFIPSLSPGEQDTESPAEQQGREKERGVIPQSTVSDPLLSRSPPSDPLSSSNDQQQQHRLVQGTLGHVIDDKERRREKDEDMIEVERERELETETDPVASIVEDVQKSMMCCLHVLDILNNVLDMSKLQEGKMLLASSPVSLLHTTQWVKVMVEKVKPAVPITMTAPDASCVVLGDSKRLRQILLNLVSNALKFTEEGYVHVRVSCERDSEEPQKYLQVNYEVRDTGSGISPEAQSRLFGKYETMTSKPGTGLGLLISHELVQLMGGKITVQSPWTPEGRGSIFRFSLRMPIADVKSGTNRGRYSPTSTTAPAGISRIGHAPTSQLSTQIGVDVSPVELFEWCKEERRKSCSEEEECEGESKRGKKTKSTRPSSYGGWNQKEIQTREQEEEKERERARDIDTQRQTSPSTTRFPFTSLPTSSSTASLNENGLLSASHSHLIVDVDSQYGSTARPSSSNVSLAPNAVPCSEEEEKEKKRESARERKLESKQKERETDFKSQLSTTRPLGLHSSLPSSLSHSHHHHHSKPFYLPPNLRVLVIDDVLINRRILERKFMSMPPFKTLSWIVQSCVSGEDALHLVNACGHHYDILVTDQSLTSGSTGLNGTDVVKRWREKEKRRGDLISPSLSHTLSHSHTTPPRTLIVLATGEVLDEEKRKKYIKDGCDIVWNKPLPSSQDMAKQLGRFFRQTEVEM